MNYSTKMRPSTRELILSACIMVLILAVALALYGPYLENPFVFDDGNLFFTSRLTTAAIAPWELGTRGLPYFTLGWVQTQLGSMEAHRLVGLFLHAMVGWQLYRMLFQMLVRGGSKDLAASPSMQKAQLTAAVIAILFVAHPTAVYGAGYLIQRTTVMAAFFALLSLRYLLRALDEKSYKYALRAALMSSLSICCKEHSVTLPIAALSLVFIVDKPVRPVLGIFAVYLIANLPATFYVIADGLGFVGQPYEPGLKNIEGEIFGLPNFSNNKERWFFSASTQAKLYFHYWLQWLMPSTSRMSADLRVDFLQPWSPVRGLVWLGLFLAVPITAAAAALFFKKFKLIAFSLIFAALSFMVEFSLVRFQEPYVLYRSYIWAIGYSVAASVLVLKIPTRWIIGIFFIVFPFIFMQARDRLETFSSRSALWEDAAAKLEDTQVAGSSRIFFNRGNERFRNGNVNGALSDIGKAIALNPINSDYYVARATTLIQVGKAEDALLDLDSADRFKPNDEKKIWFQRFRALYVLKSPAAEEALQTAARLGSFPARYYISKRQSKTSSVEILLEGVR